jgi:hypothetical protein
MDFEHKPSNTKALSMRAIANSIEIFSFCAYSASADSYGFYAMQH